MSPIAEATTWVAWMKLWWYALAIAMFEWLNIKDTQLIILTILMLVDFAVWIGWRLRINKKEVTSHKAWLWIFKKVSTLVLILSFALMFKGIWIDGTFYINWVLAIFIMAETYSILQNIHTIRTGEIHTEYDVVSKIIKWIWELIVKMIDRKINDINNIK